MRKILISFLLLTFLLIAVSCNRYDTLTAINPRAVEASPEPTIGAGCGVSAPVGSDLHSIINEDLEAEL